MGRLDFTSVKKTTGSIPVTPTITRTAHTLGTPIVTNTTPNTKTTKTVVSQKPKDPVHNAAKKTDKEIEAIRQRLAHNIVHFLSVLSLIVSIYFAGIFMGFYFNWNYRNNGCITYMFIILVLCSLFLMFDNWYFKDNSYWCVIGDLCRHFWQLIAWLLCELIDLQNIYHNKSMYIIYVVFGILCYSYYCKYFKQE